MDSTLRRLALPLIGTPKDVPAAIEWYTCAGDAGRAKAQYMLGYLYSSSGAVPADYPTANRWLLKAATQGYAVAALETLYSTPQGLGQLLADMTSVP